MNLIDVYDHPKAEDILYRLIAERTPEMSINHQRMPTRDEHEQFIVSRPYMAWYLIEIAKEIVGTIYLTRADEIGIFIFLAYQGRHYGSQAITKMMALHPRKSYRANINPKNERSIKLFEDIGFCHIQNTYEIR